MGNTDEENPNTDPAPPINPMTDPNIVYFTPKDSTEYVTLSESLTPDTSSTEEE